MRSRGGNNSLNPWLLGVLGALGLVLALGGVVHSTRAAVAANLSRRIQYGPPLEVEQVVELARKAQSLYPWNYYLAIFAAETAYYRAGEVGGELQRERLRQAALWCDRGLALNRYKSQLRRLKTNLLWEDSPAEAIRYWSAYVDWQFWEPHHHATLAELHARAGDFEQAERAVKWTEGTVAHAGARAAVDRERKAWDAILKGDVEGWGE